MDELTVFGQCSGKNVSVIYPVMRILLVKQFQETQHLFWMPQIYLHKLFDRYKQSTTKFNE